MFTIILWLLTSFVFLFTESSCIKSCASSKPYKHLSHTTSYQYVHTMKPIFIYPYCDSSFDRVLAHSMPRLCAHIQLLCFQVQQLQLCIAFYPRLHSKVFLILSQEVLKKSQNPNVVGLCFNQSLVKVRQLRSSNGLLEHLNYLFKQLDFNLLDALFLQPHPLKVLV